MSYSSEVLADSPTGYWSLDETTGTAAADATGNGHGGTYFNSPTLAQTPLITVGTAVLFNGTTQRMDIPTSAAFNNGNNITLEAWVKFSSAGTIEIIDCDDSGTSRKYQFRANAGKLDMQFISAGISATGAITINDNVKHHVVATYDGAHIILYVDGVQDVSVAASAAIANTNTGVWVASHHAGASNFFPGTIDEVAIYPTALSAARILAHYNAGLGIITDASTVSSKTTPSSDESTGRVDVSTVTGKTTPSGIDVLYRDSAIIGSITTPSNPSESFVAPSGFWGSADDDDGII